MGPEGLCFDDVIALTDADLAASLDERMGAVTNRLLAAVAIAEGEDAEERAEQLTDDLEYVIDELIERHAPEIALMRLERNYADPGYDRASEDREYDLAELRQRQAARMIRDAIEGDDA